MSTGYKIGGGEFRVWNETRNAMISSGALVGFLPTEHTFEDTASFPDVQKGRLDGWSWYSRWSPPNAPSAYGWYCFGVAMVGARPQEWSSNRTLGVAPTGANLFLGRVRIVRSSGPSHPWLGQTLSAPGYNNQWVPINGAVSMELEEAIGFSRGLSIYIADGTDAAPGTAGRLTLRLEQSVSGKCGNLRSWGDASVNPGGTSQGGENRWAGTGNDAQPVLIPTDEPGRKVSSGTTGNPLSVGRTRHKWDGPDPPTYSDPTDYSSTYSVEVVGRFGRHA